MTTRFRTVALVVALSLVWAGPLAPLALAQSLQGPATPQESQSQPAIQPAQSAPAQSMEQAPAMTLSQATAQAQPSLVPEAVKSSEGADSWDVGAAALNVIFIPGKASLCVLGGIVAIGLMGATLGSGYRSAARATEAGCTGQWVITGDDIRPERSRYGIFEWEKNLWDWEREELARGQ